MFHNPITGLKSFKRKILPATRCTPRISLRNSANLMIPIDRGGRGYPLFPNRNRFHRAQTGAPSTRRQEKSRSNIHRLALLHSVSLRASVVKPLVRITGKLEP